MEVLLDVGMLGDEPEGKAEGVGGGFVAGEHDGEALVVYLLVGHAAAVALGVGGVEEHGEQVTAIAGGCSALADHGVDEGVELGLTFVDTLHGRERQALDQGGEGQEGEGQEAHEGIDCGGDLEYFFPRLDVEVEEALAYDAQSQFEHLGVQVDDGSGAPVGGDGGGVVTDDFAIGGDALAEEGWLHEAALAHVQRLFAGEQALAEDDLGALHDDATGVFGSIFDEEVFDEIGMIELVDVAIEDFEVNEVAEFAGGGGHVGGGGAGEEASGEEAGQEGWAGRVGAGLAGADVDWDVGGGSVHGGPRCEFRRVASGEGAGLRWDSHPRDDC